MARGDHPIRTPAYGGLLIAAAMIGRRTPPLPTARKLAVGSCGGAGAVAVVAILIGALLTLRDRTPPRPRGPRPRR